MAWCFSTRASVATVLTTHPCVSRCLRVKYSALVCDALCSCMGDWFDIWQDVVASDTRCLDVARFSLQIMSTVLTLKCWSRIHTAAKLCHTGNGQYRISTRNAPFNQNLEIFFAHTYLSITQSFSQRMAVSLPYKMRYFKTIWRLRRMFWTSKICEVWVQDAFRRIYIYNNAGTYNCAELSIGKMQTTTAD